MASEHSSEPSTEHVTEQTEQTEQTEPRTEHHQQVEGKTLSHHQERTSINFDGNLVNTSILEHSGQFFDHVIKDDTASPPETAIDTLVSDMIVVEHEDSRDDDDVARFLRGDPTPLFELDKRAKDLVLKLDDMVNELHSNIDAMSICVHQAISLHSESVDSVHNTVDGAVKVMYSFLSQFNELQDSLEPLNKIYEQVTAINETLKVFERV